MNPRPANMKHISPLALLGLLTLSLAAQGQDKNNEHAGHHPAPASAAAATVNPATPITTNSALSEGEVRKVDLAAKKIILKHGEIKNLDMGAMTMVFQVNNPALLDKVKAGDKVRFTAEQVKGAFVVMSIELIQP